MIHLITTNEDFQSVIDRLEILTEEVTQLSPRPEHIVLTNKEFCERLDISQKTAQKWRDDGIIRYSQIGRCIYYRLSDVLDMLERASTDII